MKLLLGRLSMIRSLLLVDFFNLSYFCKVIKNFSVFIGMTYLQRLDSLGLLFGLFFFFKSLLIPYSNLHVISLKMGRLVAFEFNLIKTSIAGKLTKFNNSNISHFIYLCGTDFDSLYMNATQNLFLVFQGSFCDNIDFLNKFNLIFPIGVYTEVESMYINLEGRIRQTRQAINVPINVLYDWEILQALLLLGKSLCFFNFSVILNFFYIMKFFDKLINYNCGFFYNFDKLFQKIKSILSLYQFNDSFFFIWALIPVAFKQIWINSLFSGLINNYYMSDAYTRTSKTMMLCARKLNINAFNKYIYIN